MLPSPVTNSPSLKLCFGDRVVSINLLNFSKPLKNKGLTLSFFLFILFIVSGSTVGDGKVNASKPEKKRKMLSATCLLL